MKHRTHNPLSQKGSMMIEALVAILIFSMGILAMMGLQAASVKLSGDAKFRSDASLLANELIGQMWGSDRSSAPQLVTNFKCTGTNSLCSTGQTPALVTNWLTNVTAALPGVAATPPIVSVVSQPATTSGSISNLVTVKIFWKAPNDPAASNTTLCGVPVPTGNTNYAHCFIAMAQII